MTEWTPEAQERFFATLYEEVADDDDQPEDVAQKVASAVGGVTRREMLAGAGILGGGALLGGGGTAALTGNAQAAASTVDGDGDIGTPDNPEDVYADAVAVFDGASNQIGSFDETGITTPSVDTEQVSSGTHYAGAHAGSSPDARLGNALSAASDGDTIVLENATYVTNRTFTTAARLNALGSDVSGGSTLDAQWTFDVRAWVNGIRLEGSGEIVLNQNYSSVLTRVSSGNAPGVQVNADGCRISSFNHDVVFASGTSGGLVDFSVDVNVTDNGTNTVGDIG